MDDADGSPFGLKSGIQPSSAQLGISVEPINLVMQQVATLPAGPQSITGSPNAGTSDLMVVRPSSAPSTDAIIIAGKILDNLYNYCVGFAGNLPMGANALFGGDWDATFIPFKAFQDWYSNIQRRIKSDAGFLK